MKIVITGTSRGIGLELTRQALQRGDEVLAVARDPKRSQGLQELVAQFPKTMQTLALDLQSPEAAETLDLALAKWSAIDILINNAGVYRKGETLEDFLTSFHVNSVVPFLVTKALLPRLKQSQNPRVVQITSKMGSIDDNSSGGSYAYRASKTALNMINKSLAMDHDGVTCVVVHPGWVKTDMGGAGAPTEAKDSAAGIWKLALNLKQNQSGMFFDFKGEPISW